MLAEQGIAAVAVPATTAFASAPASHPTVVCDCWHGSRYGHAFGAAAEAILHLRAIIANGDFDAYWDYHLQREHHRNYPRPPGSYALAA